MSQTIGTGTQTNTGNPLIAQGSINRLKGSLTVAQFPALNVTAPYLSKEGIRMSLDGESTTFLPTLTGAVTSMEPYMMVTVTLALLKTQNLSAVYKAQMESSSLIGDLMVTPDSPAGGLPPYNFTNCAIESVREMSFAGDDATMMISIRGYYNINSTLFNLV